MVWVVFSLIFLVIGILCLLGAKFARNQEDKAVSALIGFVSGGLALVIWVCGMFTSVSANSIGVVTSFGRYQGVIQSGVHWMAPWNDVEEFGTRIQPLELNDVPIRFQGNSGGTADMLVEWRISSDDEKQIHQLWSDYHTFEAIQNRIVQSRSLNALNQTLAQFPPSEGVSGANIPRIQTSTLTLVNQELADTGIVVARITLRQISPDASSQDRINRQVQALADLQRMDTQKQIADKEAEIARTRATTQTPGTLVQTCLDMTQSWDVAKRGPLPTTWNCLGGNVPTVVGVK
jgi:regulator of protease activity HflC (stomatin/prohibitin superfamily)